MKKISRQLVVYLCKSNLTPDEDLVKIREYLIKKGFLIREYKGGLYLNSIRALSDFVLYVPYKKANIWEPLNNSTTISGKGQFDEVKKSISENKAVICYEGFNEEGEMLMTLVKERGHEIIDAYSWKQNYGTIVSYTPSGKPCPFYDFITGFMNVEHGLVHNNVREYPLTPSECFEKEQKLNLLLLLH